MRRFYRWSFNALTAASLLLCVISTSLLIKSEFAPAVFQRSTKELPTDVTIFGWVDGKIIFIRNAVTDAGTPFVGDAHHRFDRINPSAFTWPARWIFYHHSRQTYVDYQEDETDVIIHTALIIFPTVILPAIWLAKFIRRKRPAPIRNPERGPNFATTIA